MDKPLVFDHPSISRAELLHAGRCFSRNILLLILPSQMPSEKEKHNDEKNIAADMRREGDEVSRGIIGEEDLWTFAASARDVSRN